jgi:NAD(P)-dependent dehydrogenase (short-subunit alcohol dehydrogenase family)
MSENPRLMPTALVTGVNRGIGLEFTRQLAAQGWQVLACCRQPESAEALQQLAASFPGKIRLYALSVESPAQIEALAVNLRGQPLDLLINNAGYYPGGMNETLGHTNRELWLRAFEINTIAPLKISEALINNLEQGQGKTIALITSKMGSLDDNTSGGVYLYRTSKAALNMVAKSLAQDLEPRGIKVALLHPGWVKTDMGGPNAWISAQESVAGMLKIILNLGWQDTGRFLAYDGKEIEW